MSDLYGPEINAIRDGQAAYVSRMIELLVLADGVPDGNESVKEHHDLFAPSRAQDLVPHRIPTPTVSA